MNPREEIAHLTEVLERANHQYYVLDAPEMEDYEYDPAAAAAGGAGGRASGAGIAALAHAPGRRRGAEQV